jgi:hypothetical protein
LTGTSEEDGRPAVRPSVACARAWPVVRPSSAACRRGRRAALLHHDAASDLLDGAAVQASGGQPPRRRSSVAPRQPTCRGAPPPRPTSSTAPARPLVSTLGTPVTSSTCARGGPAPLLLDFISRRGTGPTPQRAPRRRPRYAPPSPRRGRHRARRCTARNGRRPLDSLLRPVPLHHSTAGDATLPPSSSWEQHRILRMRYAQRGGAALRTMCGSRTDGWSLSSVMSD